MGKELRPNKREIQMPKITLEFHLEDSQVVALLPYLVSLTAPKSSPTPFAEGGINEDQAIPPTTGSPGSGSTRSRGCMVFERQTREEGLAVRRSDNPKAGDFIVTAHGTSRPVQLICSESPRISLRREWSQPPNLVLAYIWVLSEDHNRIFLMTYTDAAAILGDALQTDSFVTGGYYTSKCSRDHQRVMSSYEDRWEIFCDASR